MDNYYDAVMDQFSAIRVFTRIVETGSLTRAAAHLGMPKSTASKLLADLETYLGVTLLHRSTRSVKLTVEGAGYYEQASRILARLAEADSDIREVGGQLKGRLRIDVHSAMANSILIPMLAEFRDLYPDILLMIGISDRPISLVEEAADCVIRLGKLPDASLIARVLFEDRLVTCASPAYLERKGMPSSPRELQKHDLIGYFSALTGEVTPLTFRQGQEIYQLEKADILSNDSSGHLGMLIAGLGIGQAYWSTVRAPIASGALLPVLEAWETQSAPVSILYPPDRRLNKRVRVFIDWLMARFAQEPGLHVT